MDLNRRTVLQGSAALGALAATGLVNGGGALAATASTQSATSLTLDHTAWKYDSTNDVYYQLGKVYVTAPESTDYENLGVYVPGKYLSATKNSDGATYTATINTSGKVGSYTARTAPIVLPVNTPGYAAQQPPTSYSYSDVSAYLAAGFVYVAPGLRGRDSNTSSYTGNAPWGVTDLKSAVRYLRYNDSLIPGSKDRIFVFGMSGGGAQSAVMGASGDSDLFAPYLKKIGAAMRDSRGRWISDAVAGAMCWCPITSLDYANAAYEWNMGQFASTGTRASGTWTKAYSDDLATAFAGYINRLGLRGSSGRPLSLSASASGNHLAGSYYDHVVSVIQTSLSNFLSDTTFPYTPTSAGGAGGGGTPPSGGTPPTGGTGTGTGTGSGTGTTTTTSTTYATIADYIAYLNTDSTWVTYDSSKKTATVTSLAGFVRSQKNATKDVGAFDGVDRGDTENLVLGLGTDPLHFAGVSRDVISRNATAYTKLTGWESDYAASEYTSDFRKSDGVGRSVGYRMNMYNPMYYLARPYGGFRSSQVAPHWRIRTGIMQGDTANTVEINLALALANLGVRSVDFATVWGLAHTQAERTGTASGNFIAWVESVTKG